MKDRVGCEKKEENQKKADECLLFKDIGRNDTSDGSFVDQDRLSDHIIIIIKDSLSPDSILIQTKVILPNYPFFCDSHASRLSH